MGAVGPVQHLRLAPQVGLGEQHAYAASRQTRASMQACSPASSRGGSLFHWFVPPFCPTLFVCPCHPACRSGVYFPAMAEQVVKTLGLALVGAPTFVCRLTAVDSTLPGGTAKLTCR